MVSSMWDFLFFFKINGSSSGGGGGGGVSAQSYLTFCDPTDCSPSGCSLHGILQARILEWVAIPFSRRSFQNRDQSWVSPTEGRFFTI